MDKSYIPIPGTDKPVDPVAQENVRGLLETVNLGKYAEQSVIMEFPSGSGSFYAGQLQDVLSLCPTEHLARDPKTLQAVAVLAIRAGIAAQTDQ